MADSRDEIASMAKCIYDYAKTTVSYESRITQRNLAQGFLAAVNRCANFLYYKGYHRVPDGAMVLNADEVSDYKLLKNNYEHVKEEALRLKNDNDRIYYNLSVVLDYQKKRTLEKVFTDMYELVSEAENNGKQVIVTVNDIKEIAKRYGVEVGE